MRNILIGVAVILVMFGAVACLDSCNRHKDTRPCFGSSQKP